MPIIKIIKDGAELATIMVPAQFEIRIIYGETVTPPVYSETQEVRQPSVVAQESNILQHEVSKEIERQAPATTAVQKPTIDVTATDEVKEVFKQELPKVEETSRRIMESLEDKDKKEKKEDIALIRKIVEGLLE